MVWPCQCISPGANQALLPDRNLRFAAAPLCLAYTAEDVDALPVWVRVPRRASAR